VRLSNDQNIEIHHATAAYNELDLAPGQKIRVAMKREALQILRRGDSA